MGRRFKSCLTRAMTEVIGIDHIYIAVVLSLAD